MGAPMTHEIQLSHIRSLWMDRIIIHTLVKHQECARADPVYAENELWFSVLDRKRPSCFAVMSNE